MRLNEYVERQERISKKHLEIVKKIFENGGFKVQDNLKEEDADNSPYLFISNGKYKNGEGVRIYKIGDHLSYRVQREFKAQPYGRAYKINIEQMYDDFIGEKKQENEIGMEIIKTVVSEVKGFFQKIANSEDISSNMLTRKFMGSTGLSDIEIV